MLRALSFVVLASIFPPGSSLAPDVLAPDVLMPGTRGLAHSHRLVGLDAFPEHRFVIAPRHIDGWEVVEDDEPFSWYKLHGTRVHAVNSGMEIPESGREPDMAWLDGLPKSAQLQRQSSVPEASRARSRETVYRVVAVDATNVELELVRDEYLGANGAMVDPSGESTLPWMPFLAGAALLGLIAIFLVVRKAG